MTKSKPSPLEFFGHLYWLDGCPLLETIEPYRQHPLDPVAFSRLINLSAQQVFSSETNPQTHRQNGYKINESHNNRSNYSSNQHS